ncbi:MAG TPA: NfeD family protein [Thiotrichales bacterium]|nr:NfeD family protein [Thiotrichales bacterium]
MEWINHWSWWTLALILLVLEIFAPGTFFLWMGVAAAVVGGLLLADPQLSLEYQLFWWALLSVASIVAWRAWARRHPRQTDHPTLNRRGDQYVGRTFTLETPIENGVGKIRVDDTHWRVEGPDLPAGEKVTVVGVDGTTLRVVATVSSGS